MNRMIEVNHLNKSFGNFQAIRDVSFSIEKNKIYGLLGRNGAGKTTLMHMITAQTFPTDGEINVFGGNPYENANILQQICFIKESQKYPDNYNVIDVLEVSKAIFPNWDEDFAYSLLEQFNLPLKRRMKKLSRGMLSAVGIIVGLASRAPLTIFDEPYLGLDAVSRELFYNKLLEDYAIHPRTVILSTHLIDEVSLLLEHILVIDHGSIIRDQDAESLRGSAITVTGPSEKVQSFIQGKKTIHSQRFGGLLTATVIQEDGVLDQEKMKANGLEISPVSLQQLVVHLTSQQADKGGTLQ